LFEISDPENPRIAYPLQDVIGVDIAVSGDYAYVVDSGGQGFQVVDISTPTASRRISSIELRRDVKAVDVSGDHAVVVHGGGLGEPPALEVFDIAMPTAPAIVGNVELDGSDVTISAGHAYVAGIDSLFVVDLAVPTAPKIVVSIYAPSEAITVLGNYAYIAGRSEGLRVIDITTPASPRTVGSAGRTKWSGDIALVPTLGLAYVADRAGVEVIDITVPSSPEYLGYVGMPGAANGLSVSGNHVYVASDSGFVSVALGRPATPVSILYTPWQAMDVAILGDRAYLASAGSGIMVISLENPDSPRFITSFDTPGSANGVAIEGTTLYVADDDQGVRVMDISTTAGPKLVTTIDTPGEAQDVVLSGGYAYIADGSSGLQVIDVANAVSPRIVGSLETTGRSWDIAVEGSYAYMADGEWGLLIQNISDPTSPVNKAWGNVPGIVYAVAVSGNRLYYVNGSDLWVTDITVPYSPKILTVEQTPGVAQGVTAFGDLVYVADGYCGVLMFDFGEPARFLGTIDTFGRARAIGVCRGRVCVADGSQPYTGHATGLYLLAPPCSATP